MDQKNKAREFAQSGANLIIGAHPHIIQEKEIIEVKEGEKIRKKIYSKYKAQDEKFQKVSSDLISKTSKIGV